MKIAKIFCLGILLLTAFSLPGAAQRGPGGPGQPGPQWMAVSHGVNQDDSSTILWDRRDGAAVVWNLATDGQTVTQSAVFGPYAGGWRATRVYPVYDANTTPMILWNRPDGAMVIYSLSANGKTYTTTPVIGPYAGWTALNIGVDSNGLTHILWTNVNGEMVLWTLTADRKNYSASELFGPISGWAAGDFAIQKDGSAEVLWNRSDGALAVWTIPATGQSFASTPVFGPFTGPNSTTWKAKSVAVVDVLSQDVIEVPTIDVLLNRSDGASAVFTLSQDEQSFTSTPVFGPFAGGGWSAQDVGLQEDGTTQLLWTNVNGMMDVHTLSTDRQSFTPSEVFGPF